jgi:uncharacterized phage protein (TIGR01671 family)
MREIKFRAWEKNLKEIIPIDSINFEHKIVNMTSAWRFFNEVELMQFTGFKDENGKEIFEGDIVEQLDEMRYESITGIVRFLEGTFYIVAIDDKEAWSIFNEVGHNTVLGNIYENPELLEVAE